MKNRIYLLLGWALVIVLSGFNLSVTSQTPPPAPALGPIVKEIVIQHIGKARVNNSVIHANIQTREGQPLGKNDLENDIRNLYNTGFFYNVRIYQEPVEGGVKVIIRVQGKATIRSIAFEENEKINDRKLQKVVSIEVGQPMNEAKIATDSQKLTEHYQKKGYQNARVTYDITVDEDTGQGSVVFKVDEGEKVRVKEIEFLGNEAFRDKKLRKQLKTKQRNLFLFRLGTLKEEEFEEDKVRLADFYRNNGYLDFEIKDIKVEKISSRRVRVIITVYEGIKYTVGELDIKGNTLFSVDEIREQLKMKEGETFTPLGLDKDTEAIQDIYGTKGYIDAQIKPLKSPSSQTGKMNLSYQITENKISYINRINIKGNVKTKDKVIRRELAVQPGEIYDGVKVKRSRERLQNIGYFSKVTTSPEETDIPNRKNLEIEVEEQKTGQVTFGAGFSSIDSLLGFVEVTQGNFDLFNPWGFTGAGQKFRARLQLGTKRRDYIISFTEPWFLDKRLSLGFDLFRNEAEYLSDEYTEIRTGGDIKLAKAFGEFIADEIQYRIENVEIDVNETNGVSKAILNERGSRLVTSFINTYTFDTRDNVFLTTRGNRTDFTAQLAGPFGGETDFYKLFVKSSFYFSPIDGHVVQLLGAAGVAEAWGRSEKVPYFDRFFLGGGTTLRGFRYRDVGPRDESTDDPIGGLTTAYATIEYTIPVIERVRFATFLDVGNVWRDAYDFDFGNYNADVGVGLRFNLPIGPLRLDYGIPIKDDGDNGGSGRFNFNLGYQF